MRTRALKKSFFYNFIRSFYNISSYSFGSYVKFKLRNYSVNSEEYKRISFSSLKNVFYWIYYLNYISLFKNINNSRNSRYFNEHSLNLDGFARLNDLDINFVTKLIDFYLEKVNFSGTLAQYFEQSSMKGDVRPEGINLISHPQILKEILNQSSILPIIKEHLGISFDDMHIYGKFDTLIKLSSDRKVKDHDDALVFHRDFDSCKAVKVFFYLNDIGDGCGHHEIYLKSHRELPLKLRPVKRYTKKDIEEYINCENFKKVIGPAGYSFIENTSCFHRGTVPTEGHRMIITLSFNDSKSIRRLQRDVVNEEVYYAPLERFI